MIKLNLAITWLTRTLAAGLILMLASTSARATLMEYTGDALPSSDDWYYSHGPYPVVEIVDGNLHLVNTTSAVAGNWFSKNPLAHGSDMFLEIRAMLSYSNNANNGHPFMVISNGEHFFSFGFNSNRINLGGQSFYDFDTSEFHTYSVRTSGNMADVYIDGELIASQAMAVSAAAPVVNFGSGCTACAFDWSIDYIKWQENSAREVPEPASAMFFGIGLIGLAAYRKRKQRKNR
ncbi:PEP-CTERM sorting domain-containing protein [Thalassomonas viridans]|uniref:PEP-CTERM sorting domain-containing protein n=1 Tax=Thalassomonas viridans TaxID=137584 RepID=A0AAE9ZAG4_9GAMM|nr:PEP-CTERM sorting domain-containing protein [Thalassomonas viridans]WDE08854.1 PEP-CTERM sorting domain-containing protein [Thalassomonas viridans]